MINAAFDKKSRRHVADLLDLSRHVEIDLSCRRPGTRLFLVSDLSATCRRPGFKQVLSKIDVMEFGHKSATCATSQRGSYALVAIRQQVNDVPGKLL